MKHFKFLLLLMLILPGLSLFGQANQNEGVKVNNKVSVGGGERTDFIFTRTFMLGSSDESFIDNARSGGYSIGIGYGIPIGTVLEFKFEPRVTWHKLYFPQTSDTAKYYPSSSTSSELVYEKVRTFFLEVPLGLKFKLARNAEDKYKFLLEGGFNFGLNLGGTLKTRFRGAFSDPDGDDQKLTYKLTNIPDVNILRYGPYARIGTNWISLYGFYRMSEMFDEDATVPGTNNPYPIFPNIELGLSITI